METPLKAPNISALLSENAQQRGAETAYTILGNGHDESDVLTHGALDLLARATATRLQRSLRAGDRALILAVDNADFIRAFMACQYAGVVAVPVAPPLPLRNPRKVATLRTIAQDCGARAVLTGSGTALREPVGELSPELAALEWIEVDTVPVSEASGYRAPRIGAEDLSFLQYTSGSTSLPKGVMVSHRALLRNEEMFSAVMGMTSEDVIVSWLPLYHDMGLIGKVLQSSYLGAHLVLMPSAAFVQRPARWLRAITRYRGTVSGAPNFAYDLCVGRVSEEDRAELDLSSWKVAFSGAEPIRPATFEAFSAAYASHGLAPETLQTGYGLAEATLVASGGVRGEPPLTRDVDREQLRRGRAVPGDDYTMISVGRARLSRRFVIADPATLRRCENGVVGEIWMSGADLPLGYWGRPDTTRETFGARLADTGEGPFLRTGDLGVLLDGELYITGRLKDMIIVGGLNHYPQDIETSAEAAHPWIRPGCCAAFAVERDGREQVVLVAEVIRPSGSWRAAGGTAPPAVPTLAQIRRQVAMTVSADHGIQLDDIHLVAPASTFKTSSGKIQRAWCRTAYEQGEFTPAREPGGHALEGVTR
ncbi:fatty acyl-AMP ligase [Streptomyces sp. NPDC005827]|uniref:fatty acyl-AMP ligase n=1 Tax=Streptomyces sp. NPDC005827 TaxID=3157070 RepID=UPI00340AC848